MQNPTGTFERFSSSDRKSRGVASKVPGSPYLALPPATHAADVHSIDSDSDESGGATDGMSAMRLY